MPQAISSALTNNTEIGCKSTAIILYTQMKNESINYHTLSNGIRIVHRHSSSAVSYLGLIVGCGTRDEQTQINGAAHFVEHCVF